MLRIVFSFLLSLLLVSSFSYGCSVCGFSKEESRKAFLFTTALLTFLPLSIIGGAGYYVFRRLKGYDEDQG